MEVDFPLDEAVDDRALADPAVPQQDDLVLKLREAAAVELGGVHLNPL